MGSRFCDPSLAQKVNAIGLSGRGVAMGDEKDCPSFGPSVEAREPVGF